MTLQEQFDAFHAANPDVYNRLRELATSAVERGHKRVGMKMLFEVVRWEHFIDTADPAGFKLNNNYTAFYARLMMAQEDQLAGVFEVREQRHTRTQFDVVSVANRRHLLSRVQTPAPPADPPLPPAPEGRLFALPNERLEDAA